MASLGIASGNVHGALVTTIPAHRQLSEVDRSCPMSEFTEIMRAIEAGDPRAAEKLLPLVYVGLRTLAAAQLANEQPGQSLQPTALLHEAFLRLVAGANPGPCNSRGHFF